jgi:hypothetical protein
VRVPRRLALCDATPHAEKFATAAFRAFVRRAVERHGCGGLRLPG